MLKSPIALLTSAMLALSFSVTSTADSVLTAKVIKPTKPNLQTTVHTISPKMLIQLSTIELQVDKAILAFDKDGNFKNIENSRGETLVRAGDEFTKRGTSSPTMTLVNSLSAGFAAGRPGIQTSESTQNAHSNWPNTIIDKEREEHIVKINEDGGMVPEDYAETLPSFNVTLPKPPGGKDDSRTTEISESGEGGEIDPQKLIEALRGETINPGLDAESKAKGKLVGPIGPGTFDPASDDDDSSDKPGIIDANKLKEIKPGVIVDVR